MPPLTRPVRRFVLWMFVTCAVAAAPSASPTGPVTAAAAEPPLRLLILVQGPDGHPPGTHEFVAGGEILRELLAPVEGVAAEVVRADEPWPSGPELLAEADGVVLFVSQGARWLAADPRRTEAVARLAQRGGALVGLHWGIGGKEAADVPAFVSLWGACHGGPDRRYQVLETDLSLPTPEHPIARGLAPFRVHDEFYFQLKQPPSGTPPVPIVAALIEDQPQMVAWAWERGDGGRSFGFSGLHFHANWQRVPYRRLVAQGVLWTLGVDIPPEGVDVTLADRPD